MKTYFSQTLKKKVTVPNDLLVTTQIVFEVDGDEFCEISQEDFLEGLKKYFKELGYKPRISIEIDHI